MKEKWKPIIGFESAYSVSDRGRIRSHDRKVNIHHGGLRPVKGQIIKPVQSNQSGHLKVTLPDRKGHLIHRLVLTAFVGPCPDGMQGCHEDGDPRNNDLDNLRWGTPADNWIDRIRHGNNTVGERNGNSKLAESDVVRMRNLYATGDYTQKAIGDLFHVHQATVWAIVTHAGWKHID